MAEKTFNEYGKTQAIDLLFESSGFSRQGKIGFEPAAGSFLSSASRLFVEGMDFDLTYFPLKHLGYKSVVAVAGEIYASMSHPRLLSVRLGVSAKLDFSHIKDLWLGVVTAAKEHGFSAVDLDLVPSPNGLTISVSAIGEEFKLTKGRKVKARSMDLVCVSGSLGAAFLGQQPLPVYLDVFGVDAHGVKVIGRHAVCLDGFKARVGSTAQGLLVKLRLMVGAKRKHGRFSFQDCPLMRVGVRMGSPVM